MSVWTDIAADVRGLTMPALAIAGDDDPVYGPAYQQEAVVPYFPGARLVSVPDCGHGLILEKPGEIARHLKAFLADICKDRGRRIAS
jgi:pimeloyl-ACP methyl ester carboxylesterase